MTKTMTAEELVERCEISLIGDNKLQARNVTLAKKMIDEIRARRGEIISYLVSQKAAAEERESNIAAIKGLDELQAAMDAEGNYHEEVDRRFEDEALSSIMPARPKVSAQDLAAKYPRAAAYIKAEAWKYASHYAKVAAGEKALERIINGEDHKQVLADMQAEWTAHCNEHVWD